MATRTKTLSPTTLGHPYRNADTGLVPDSEAYDPEWADDEGFGDGVSIVEVHAGVTTNGRYLDVVCMIRPNEDQAPKDSCGRPMTCWLAQGAHDTYDLTQPDAIDRAVNDLVTRGITAAYAGKVISTAVAIHGEGIACKARVAALLASTDGAPDLLAEMLTQVGLDREDQSRIALRATLTDFVANHPDDVHVLRREIERRKRS